MIIRQHIFDTYWKFAALRQRAFFARLHGAEPPWCDDEIIGKYKFCNAYRASDRVSQYLIRKVIYGGGCGDEDTVFRIVLFKLFNRIETWEHLERRLGELALSSFDFSRYDAVIQEALDAGQAIYTSAYMSCANKVFGYDRKHRNHLALLERMFVTDRLACAILQAKSLEGVYRNLLSYPLIGRFTAYQVAIDINYSPVVDFSENDFTVPGPGAERGIEKCFVDSGGKDESYIIRWMVERQDDEFARLGIAFQDLWGRPLQCIDCQGLFCETDKYCREAHPELKSNRTRIKARFSPNPSPIRYLYPPKWGINANVQQVVATDKVRSGVTAAHERADSGGSVFPLCGG